MSTITDYMKKKRVRKDLQIKIKKYLEYALAVDATLDSNEVYLKTYLNESLKDELIREIYGKVLLEATVFKRFEHDCIARAALIMREKIFSPEDVIFLEYKYKDTNIYFINGGKVEIFHFFSSSYLRTLARDECFGQISFFTGKPHSISARSADFSSVYYIKRDEFLVLLDEFPLEREKFHEVKDKIRLYKNYNEVGAYCYACNASDHVIASCPKVHLQIDREKYLKAYIEVRNSYMKGYLRFGKRTPHAGDRFKKMIGAAKAIQRKIAGGAYHHSRTRIVETMYDWSNVEKPTKYHPISVRDVQTRKRDTQYDIDIVRSTSRGRSTVANELDDQIKIKYEIPGGGFMPKHLSLIFTPRRDDELSIKAGDFNEILDKGHSADRTTTTFESDIDKIHSFVNYFPHNNFSTMYPHSLLRPTTALFDYNTGTGTTKTVLKKFLNIMKRRMTEKRENGSSRADSFTTKPIPLDTSALPNSPIRANRQPRRSRFYQERPLLYFPQNIQPESGDESVDDEYENEH